jgi:photosystem II stability/assembly factor-like uncharacterized protein
VFEMLSAQLADVPVGAASTATHSGAGRRRWRERSRRRLALRSLAAAVAVAAVAVAASLAVTEGVAPSPKWAFAGEISPSWRQVPGSRPSGVFLTCPSATTCYAEAPLPVEGSVEVTRDGGKTWDPAPTKGGTPLTNVACDSVARCAFVEVGPSGEPVFFQTADAGRTWTSHPGPAKLSYAYQLVKGPSGSRYSMGPVDMSCPTASTCTVVAAGLAPSRFGAFVTEDGGWTWSSSPMPSPSHQVQCFPDARCVAGAEDGANYSTDNGLEWSPAWTPGYTLQMLSCSSSQRCMAVSSGLGGGPASLVVSDNGGESWSTLPAQGLPAGEVFLGLACPTVSDCWISGDAPVNLGGGRTVVGGDTGGAVVLSSANGGRTWQGTGLPKAITGIFAISCPNPTTCFAMASRGPVVTSSGPPAGPPSLALLVYTAPG